MSTKKILLSLAVTFIAAVSYAQPGMMPPPPPQIPPQIPHGVPPMGGPQMGVPHNHDSQPLLIISGKEVPFEMMRTIRPDDIESMSILRDSTMTARFGEKGKDGVIIVRLKSDTPRVDRNSARARNNFTGNVDELVVDGDHGFQRPELPKNLVPYSSLTTEPSFMGGDENTFVKWLSDKIVRPDNCTHSGQMLVSFVIQADGTVTNVKIMRGVCEVLDALVLKAVSDSPAWTPGKVEELPVNVMYTMPIVFKYR